MSWARLCARTLHQHCFPALIMGSWPGGKPHACALGAGAPCMLRSPHALHGRCHPSRCSHVRPAGHVNPRRAQHRAGGHSDGWRRRECFCSNCCHGAGDWGATPSAPVPSLLPCQGCSQWTKEARFAWTPTCRGQGLCAPPRRFSASNSPHPPLSSCRPGMQICGFQVGANKGQSRAGNQLEGLCNPPQPGGACCTSVYRFYARHLG